MKNLTILILGVLLGVSCANAQSKVQIKSNGSNILLSIWSGGDDPIATVLALPGWGGGPRDVMGIGEALSPQRITVVVLCPRGWHESEGTASFSNGLEDVKTAIDWIRNSSRSDINSTSIVLGGHSWGGGMALAYSAQDTTVNKIFSIAGTDHGIFIRKYLSDKDFAGLVDRGLAATAEPEGPLQFKPGDIITELTESVQVLGLIENAVHLKGRSIMILGGWEDTNVSIDDFLLPDYRAFKEAGVEDILFKTYHDNHGFNRVRNEILSDLYSWIKKD